jgi:uncharacterized membrane protein YphA (DoxX/SURF4 family)
MIRKLAIIVGVGILYPMLIYFGVGAFQPLPEIQHTVYVTARIAPTTPEGWKAWDEENRVAEQRHQQALVALDKATQPFYRALILFATPLGVAAILVGSFLKFHSVGLGLILGGFISIANAYSDYWTHLDDWLRYLSLLLAFCLAVFVGYREFTVRPNNPT